MSPDAQSTVPASSPDWRTELAHLDSAAAACARDRAGTVLTWARGSNPDACAVTASTVQYAASITKQFTAALIARAVLDGLLREDTALRAVLPHLPTWARDVTVHHLIHHTAGLPTTQAVTAAAGCAEHDLDNDRVLQALTRIDQPQHPPGRAFAYSNTGYVLLAEVLHRVTGTDLDVLARAVLFAPLGLASARWGGPPVAVVPGQPTPPGTTGDGGLWLSTADLLRWLTALNEDALGSAVTELMSQPGLLQDGTTVPYAWGATARRHPRGTLFTHGGDWPGWTAKTVRQPATGAAVAVMTYGADAVAVSTAAVNVVEYLLPAWPGGEGS
ncbi:beta-lactamase family protein [Kineococcus sp. NBC_00420]|uniref:serine hydrolase domain-containing protein n=1 Tax=Kineococcus sp. NBC_00420 TaxID=2903564 RepID=UPI002E2170DC